jgi:hypothetical protein
VIRSWDTFLHYFKKTENFTTAQIPIRDIPPPDLQFHNLTGPIDVIVQSNVSKYTFSLTKCLSTDYVLRVYEDYVVPTLKNLNRTIHGEYNNGAPIGVSQMQMVRLTCSSFPANITCFRLAFLAGTNALTLLPATVR